MKPIVLTPSQIFIVRKDMTELVSKLVCNLSPLPVSGRKLYEERIDSRGTIVSSRGWIIGWCRHDDDSTCERSPQQSVQVRSNIYKKHLHVVRLSRPPTEWRNDYIHPDINLVRLDTRILDV